MTLTELESVARAATPGPWNVRSRHGSITAGVERDYVNGTAQDQIVMVCPVDPDNQGSQAANTAHIAAMSPDVALKLIAVAQAAKAYYTGYAQDEAANETGCSIEQVSAAIALRDAIAELEGT